MRSWKAKKFRDPTARKMKSNSDTYARKAMKRMDAFVKGKRV